MASVTTSAARLPLAGRAVFAVPAGVALAALGLLVRAVLADVAPGSGLFLVLLPAVAVAAALWGTLSGTVAALTEAGAAPVLYPGQPVSQLFGDVLFVLGAAVMLAAIRMLRREGARAAAAEARLAEVFRQVPAAAAIITAPSGELLTRSEQLPRILGRPTPAFGDLDALGAHGGVHRDGRPYAPQDYPIARALLRGEVTDGEGLRYRRPDGRVVELEVHAGPVRDAEGRIVAAVGMAFDVSDRVAAELRLRAALEAGALGTWEIDVASRRMRCDATMAAMFGLPAAATELTREDMRRFFDPEDRAAVFDCAAVQGEPGAAEIAIRTVQGERRWLVVRGAKLPDTGQRFGVARDITDRRMREEAASRELDERTLLLREADHRIKNSLQLVVAMLRLQADRVADPQARAAL
ncbi:MAG TPA: PAS domain S-box protein [Acetobacteraceae bacterium]|nr:PAS domain S-box protein [Acetobacteraceae bacterium]